MYINVYNQNVYKYPKHLQQLRVWGRQFGTSRPILRAMAFINDKESATCTWEMGWTLCQWVDKKGKILTGNHRFSHDTWDLPVFFSLKPINWLWEQFKNREHIWKHTRKYEKMKETPTSKFDDVDLSITWICMLDIGKLQNRNELEKHMKNNRMHVYLLEGLQKLVIHDGETNIYKAYRTSFEGWDEK